MAIHLPFQKLSAWQQITFSAALIERMLPNYQMFSAVENFGDVAVLKNQLNLIWQWLDRKNRVKINYDAQIAKLEAQVPDPETFDSFGVFPAIDACMALLSLLQFMQDKEQQGAESVSKLSENTVAYYCELEQAQIEEDENTASHQATETLFDEHPLMQWEIATQNELFDFIQNQTETVKACKLAKAIVLEEGMSSLGIEIA